MKETNKKYLKMDGTSGIVITEEIRKIMDESHFILVDFDDTLALGASYLNKELVKYIKENKNKKDKKIIIVTNYKFYDNLSLQLKFLTVGGGLLTQLSRQEVILQCLDDSDPLDLINIVADEDALKKKETQNKVKKTNFSEHKNIFFFVHFLQNKFLALSRELENSLMQNSRDEDLDEKLKKECENILLKKHKSLGEFRKEVNDFLVGFDSQEKIAPLVFYIQKKVEDIRPKRSVNVGGKNNGVSGKCTKDNHFSCVCDIVKLSLPESEMEEFGNKKFVMLDDMKKNLNDMAKFAEKEKVEFSGIHLDVLSLKEKARPGGEYKRSSNAPASVEENRLQNVKNQSQVNRSLARKIAIGIFIFVALFGGSALAILSCGALPAIAAVVGLTALSFVAKAAVILPVLAAFSMAIAYGATTIKKNWKVVLAGVGIGLLAAGIIAATIFTGGGALVAGVALAAGVSKAVAASVLITGTGLACFSAVVGLPPLMSMIASGIRYVASGAKNVAGEVKKTIVSKLGIFPVSEKKYETTPKIIGKIPTI